jgi:choline kinase
MALFDSQIKTAQTDIQNDINQLASNVTASIVAAASQFKEVTETILNEYTIQIKFVKNSK